MNRKYWLRVLIGLLSLLWLGGCASNNAMTLLEASGQTDPVVPNKEVVVTQFKNRAVRLNKIYLDLQMPIEEVGELRGESYVRLLSDQLAKGFAQAALDKGDQPAIRIKVAILNAKFTEGRLLIPDPSILRIRLEATGVDGTDYMRVELESRYLPTVSVITPNLVTALPVRIRQQQYTAIGKMVPAMAVVCTAILQGLQQGMTLDEIPVYPNRYLAGGVIAPEPILENAPYGIREISQNEIDAILHP